MNTILIGTPTENNGQTLGYSFKYTEPLPDNFKLASFLDASNNEYALLTLNKNTLGKRNIKYSIPSKNFNLESDYTLSEN